MGVTERTEVAEASGVPLESPVIRRIVPTKRRIRPTDIFREQSVVRVLASRDFKVKYKQSLLGPIWLLFQPLALLAAFLVAFRGLADVEPGIPYVVFVLTGLCVWSFFQAAMTIGTASLITNLILIKFTPCMRLAFPTASTIASLPTFAVTLVAALGAAAVTGTLSPRVVLLPIGFFWLLLLTLGAVAISSALAVRFRDIISVVPFLLQLGLFLAPIGFPLFSLSETVRTLIDFNPVTGLIEAFRWMMLTGYHPSFEPIGVSLVMTTVVAVSGWLLFSRLETTMADEI
jgi:homopolymeric O-antigen transport system permease protein